MKPSVFRGKKGSFSEALNISAKWVFLFLFSNYMYIINPLPNKYWVPDTSRGGHFLVKMGLFSESIYSNT